MKRAPRRFGMPALAFRPWLHAHKTHEGFCKGCEPDRNGRHYGEPARPRPATLRYEVVAVISASPSPPHRRAWRARSNRALGTPTSLVVVAFCAAVSSFIRAYLVRELDLRREARSFPRGSRLRPTRWKVAQCAPEGPARARSPAATCGGRGYAFAPATAALCREPAARPKDGPARLRTIALLDKPTRRLRSTFKGPTEPASQIPRRNSSSATDIDNA